MRLFEIVGSNTDALIAIAAISVLVVLIIPLPQSLLDILLTLNITLSIITLMVAVYLLHPLEFSVFPGLLLLLTLFRLSLNVASTRLILGEGDAGRVIEAFGHFVVKGNYVVGFVIFIILIIIQFVVIVKGAGRISEVAARFTLDAMPGKQMAIDADLNAGNIDENTARHRRQEISREADFYGAMDGASKFVRGDAIAGLVINVVNILGGFVIGVAQMGLSFEEAIKKFTLLTVGDGLVTQIPALVVATAAGIVVTRSSSGGGTLGIELKQQLLGKPKVLFVVAAALL
ncbi:MAG: FHIPEP family type III secretion protein, partial [Ignavibacteriales bacterium]|nr:FHIPEP family type III secretion protein [Ignavibacteriales bacterium]